MVTRPDKTDALAREREGAVRELLKSLPDYEAAHLMGSRERLSRVHGGEDWLAVTQEGVRTEYRLARVRDGMADNLAVNEAYLAALEPGGPHHGMLLNIRATQGLSQLRAGVAKMTRRIEEHRQWIADPYTKPGVSAYSAEDIARWVSEKWPSDIRRLTEQRAIYEAVIKEKEDAGKSSDS